MSKFLTALSLIGGISFLSAQLLNASLGGQHEDFTTQDEPSSIHISRSEPDDFDNIRE